VSAAEWATASDATPLHEDSNAPH